MKLIFATHNAQKVEEIKHMMPQTELLSLQDLGYHDEIPENGSTLTENAVFKANYVYQRYFLNCFADDTGLEVAALNNAPGVYSARYAGLQKSTKDNICKLLDDLKPYKNREAQFKTVIALYLHSKLIIFEGVCKGSITKEARGHHGFGYDPVFIPYGYNKTFAELPPQVKNSIGHRGIAVQKLIAFLKDPCL